MIYYISSIESNTTLLNFHFYTFEMRIQFFYILKKIHLNSFSPRSFNISK